MPLATRAFTHVTLLCLALSGSGCVALIGKHSDSIGDVGLVGSTWMTMTVDGASVPVDVVSTLSFPSGTSLTGNGGCNPFSATLGIAADELDVGPISRGRRACAPQVMDAEARYLTALQAVRSFRGTDLFLYLSDEFGTERVTLSRVPDTAPQPIPGP